MVLRGGWLKNSSFCRRNLLWAHISIYSDYTHLWSFGLTANSVLLFIRHNGSFDLTNQLLVVSQERDLYPWSATRNKRDSAETLSTDYVDSCESQALAREERSAAVEKMNPSKNIAFCLALRWRLSFPSTVEISHSLRVVEYFVQTLISFPLHKFHLCLTIPIVEQ